MSALVNEGVNLVVQTAKSLSGLIRDTGHLYSNNFSVKCISGVQQQKHQNTVK